MASTAALAFLALAGLTFVGFLAGRFFERTRFPDIPILLGLGLLVGPVNRLAVSKGMGWVELDRVLSQERLLDVAPFVAGLALVVLLFDSGLALDFQAFRRSLGPAFRHTMPILVITVGGVILLCHFVLGMPVFVAAVFAVAVAVVDQTVSSGTLDRMRISADIRATYFVEMALYDLVSIPLLVALIVAAGGAAQGVGAIPAFASLTAVSLAMGIGVGLFWAYALRGLRGHPHSYMLTFAATLAVYALSELLGGSGALSLLLFGLIVGNRTWILKRFGHLRDVDGEHEKVQAFHDEITFFVRTLYFLFLGASVTPTSMVDWPAATRLDSLGPLGRGLPLVLTATGILTVGIVLARYLPIWLSARRHPERMHLFPVFGRGLDTAVLTTLPFIAAGFVEGTAYHTKIAAWQPVLLNLAFGIVLSSVLVSSILVYFQDRRAGGPRTAPVPTSHVTFSTVPSTPSPAPPPRPPTRASPETGPATRIPRPASKPPARAPSKGPPRKR